MKVSKYRAKKTAKLQADARKLYKQGLSTRQIGAIVGKSHTWVSEAVK